MMDKTKETRLKKRIRLNFLLSIRSCTIVDAEDTGIIKIFKQKSKNKRTNNVKTTNTKHTSLYGSKGFSYIMIV